MVWKADVAPKNIFLMQHIKLLLQFPTKVLRHPPTSAISLFQENLSVRLLCPIQCCLSWWSRHCSFTTLSGGGGGGGEREFPIVVMSFGIVSKIPCQRISCSLIQVPWKTSLQISTLVLDFQTQCEAYTKPECVGIIILSEIFTHRLYKLFSFSLSAQVCR